MIAVVTLLTLLCLSPSANAHRQLHRHLNYKSSMIYKIYGSNTGAQDPPKISATVEDDGGVIYQPSDSLTTKPPSTTPVTLGPFVQWPAVTIKSTPKDMTTSTTTKQPPIKKETIVGTGDFGAFDLAINQPNLTNPGDNTTSPDEDTSLLFPFDFNIINNDDMPKVTLEEYLDWHCNLVGSTLGGVPPECVYYFANLAKNQSTQNTTETTVPISTTTGTPLVEGTNSGGMTTGGQSSQNPSNVSISTTNTAEKSAPIVGGTDKKDEKETKEKEKSDIENTGKIIDLKNMTSQKMDELFSK